MIDSTLAAILLVFYLFCLARWNVVKRPAPYLIGALGLVLVLVGRFFAVGGNPSAGVVVVTRILDVVGLLVAFCMAVVSCYGAPLPLEGLKRISQTHNAESPAGEQGAGGSSC